MYGPSPDTKHPMKGFPQIDPDGSIQGMVGGVLVQVSGSASEADKIAYL